MIALTSVPTRKTEEELVEERAEARRLETVRRRAKIRLGMMAAYLGAAIGIPTYWFLYRGGTLDALVILFSIYLFIRAIAVFVKYKQETRPIRYTRAYVEARDETLPELSDDQTSNGTDPTKKGNPDG